MAARADDAFERWINAMPEGKLELIHGKLIISSLAGSRRISWNLLRDYGPPIVLGHAPPSLWWQALAEAFRPEPRPERPDQWWQWAASLPYDPEPPPAGPQVTVEHRRTYQALMWGLHHFCDATGLGRNFGRDFVVRLGDDGLTPDQIVIDVSRLANLHYCHFEGPPTVVLEVTQPGSETQDRHLKRTLYERGRVPEYWLFDPFAREAVFWRLDEAGHYQPAAPDAAGVYQSAAMPGLALSLPDLWSIKADSWHEGCRPFLLCGRRPRQPRPPLSSRRDDDLGWDSLPFAPRVTLGPCPIRFEEFASWCGRAKFENYGGGLKIDGATATRRIAGMLLMTLGLTDFVRLAHPRDWIAFLAPELHQPLADEHIAALLRGATYETQTGFHDETYCRGEIPDVDAVTTYADDEPACRAELATAVRNWVLLRLARGEEFVPPSGR